MWTKQYFTLKFSLQLAEIFFQESQSKETWEIINFSWSILSFKEIQVRKAGLIAQKF